MIRNTFFPYFPSPQFLTLPHYGVHISSDSLKYIHVHKKKNRNHNKTIDWGEITLSNTIPIDDIVHSKKELATILKKFRLETDASYIALSLPAKYIHIFEIETKTTDTETEIESLLEFRYKEKINIPFKKVVFDYIIVNSEKNGVVRVIVAAYPKDVVETYYDACEKAGLMPVSFAVDIESAAKAVIDKNSTDNVMVVNMGGSETTIGIVCNNILHYTDVIDFGSRLILQSFKKANPTSSPQETKSFNEKQGILPIRKKGEEGEALLQLFSLLKDELITQLRAWHEKKIGRESRIDTIVLCGENVQIAGLSEYLTKQIHIPVTCGDVWKHIAFESTIPPISRSKSFEFAVSIGLALEKKV
jgi:type IV pilus assembly protein PilM